MRAPGAVLGFLAARAMLAAADSHAAELAVEIKGLRSDGGEVRVGLFDDPAAFATDAGKIGELILKPSGGVARGTFPDLAPGAYALASYHDENGNRSFDQGFLGWPLEGFAFSNDAAVSFFGPPPFGRAAIIVPAGGAAVAIRMVYW